jgi:ubiquinone/menaquinone biosynthesis C-methylase UbiE
MLDCVWSSDVCSSDLLAKTASQVRVTGVDASPAMLELGRKALSAAGVGGRVELLCGRLPGLPLPEGGFDAVLSNSLAHHLPDATDLWREVARLAAPGGFVYVMDLLRPESPQRAKAIVEAAAKDEHPLLKEDFYNSLLAAFTLEEVRDQLAAAGLRGLEPKQVSERHWLVAGRR